MTKIPSPKLPKKPNPVKKAAEKVENSVKTSVKTVVEAAAQVVLGSKLGE